MTTKRYQMQSDSRAVRALIRRFWMIGNTYPAAVMSRTPANTVAYTQRHGRTALRIKRAISPIRGSVMSRGFVSGDTCFLMTVCFMEDHIKKDSENQAVICSAAHSILKPQSFARSPAIPGFG